MSLPEPAQAHNVRINAVQIGHTYLCCSFGVELWEVRLLKEVLRFHTFSLQRQTGRHSCDLSFDQS